LHLLLLSHIHLAHCVALQEMLNGQKLQGVLTSDEVQEILHARGWELEFPLFTTINHIIHGEVPVTMILR
jgi:glycerol-3-phosphate dehydrogenase (NAD+)